MGEERKLYKVLVEKPEGKKPLGRRRLTREVRIRMDLNGDWFGVVWIGLDWLRIGTGGELL
jgi:hypothetical protein